MASLNGNFVIKCLGVTYNENHLYLNVDASNNVVLGANPQTFFITAAVPPPKKHDPLNANDFVTIASGSNYINGKTGNGTVNVVSKQESGTWWTIWGVQQEGLSFNALQCMGTDFNQNHVFLNGETKGGGVNLSPTFSVYAYSGAIWQLIQA